MSNTTKATGKVGEEIPFPVVRIDPEVKQPEPERIPVFYIGDREYTAIKSITPRMALKAMQQQAEGGIQAMLWHMLVEGVGQEAIDDLLACDAVSDDHIQGIFGSLSSMYYGQLQSLGKK